MLDDNDLKGEKYRVRWGSRPIGLLHIKQDSSKDFKVLFLKLLISH